jgi:glycerol-3-phosphate dehydrogenase (NAD(P)+)
LTDSIAVLGAGSWGTALALLLSRNGYPVRLWGLSDEIDQLKLDRENKRFLPGYPFPENLTPENDLNQAIAGVSEVLVAVPSHAFSKVVEAIGPQLEDSTTLCWATKGFEFATQRLLSDVAISHLGDRSIAVISGPSFAGEVAKGLPTAVTVAATCDEHANRLAGYLHSDTFRAYTTHDLIGVQVGGACKNVLAIAAGISDGLNFGANARSALITRGLNEIMRLGSALGSQSETFMGLAGMGDLVLTCTDNQSRNRRMGLALAKGMSIAEAKVEIGQEVEGVQTTKEVYKLAERLNVEMPITTQIHRILFEGISPEEAVKTLLLRKQKMEH